jgi:hypothetical protein
MGQSSCQVTYSAGSGGSGTHDITAAYGGDTIHDGSVDEASILFQEFLSAPPPPTFVGPNQLVVNGCAALRKELRKAKKAHNTSKVRKLKKKLKNRCGIR